MQRCRRCGQEKIISEFDVNLQDIRQVTCRLCLVS